MTTQTTIDWDDAPDKTATHYAVDSIAPWERRNPDGTGDYWSPVLGTWSELFADYDAMLHHERDIIPRLTRPESEDDQ